MHLDQIINRSMDPFPNEGTGRLPWDDRDFSRRMLREHLSQKYDSASRRTNLIKKHVDWIHNFVLKAHSSKILDLGCGPGLYTSRLAEYGHECVGIDFAPASIDYANTMALKKNLNCVYRQEDIINADYGNGFDLVMLVFSEFNTFQEIDAHTILESSHQSLKPGGKILLEVPNYEAVEQLGDQPSVWYSEKNGLFSNEPYLCLTESFWNDEKRVAIERYYIITGLSQDVKIYMNCTNAYKDDEFKRMLSNAGFTRINFHPSLTGAKEQQMDGMFVIIAEA